MASDEAPSDLEVEEEEEEEEEEQYVLRSGVRAGLKREFVFAMHAQSQLPSLFGRTRSSQSLKKPKISQLQLPLSTPSQLSDPLPLPPSLVHVNVPTSTDTLHQSPASFSFSFSFSDKKPPLGGMKSEEAALHRPLPGPQNQTPLYTYSRRKRLKTTFFKEESEVAKMEAVSKPMEDQLQLESPVSTDKSVRIFTGSALMQTSEENGSDRVASDTLHDDVARQEQVPGRPLVRLLLKDQAEGSRSGAVAGQPNEIGVPSRKNNMEIKMSKKISVNKVPGTVRDLLSTGLLEGLAVEYKFPNGRLPVLRGIIKGTKILCSCTNCRGSKAVSPLDFELHAKSMKKHPSKYIYLENGNNLSAVMKACTEVPLDMLESVIQEAAGTASQQKATTCMNCKGATSILFELAIGNAPNLLATRPVFNSTKLVNFNVLLYRP